MKKLAVILAVILAAVVSDLALSRNNYVMKNNDAFERNDFEITQKKHPETVWDRVYFGDGAVASGYMEEISTAMYVNLGIEDGEISDLWEMIRGRYIRIGKELVIGLNYCTLAGGSGENHYYVWQKKPFVPYTYYDRNRISSYFKGENKNNTQEKQLYYGTVSERAAADILKSAYYAEKPAENLNQNLDALGKIIDYCDEKKIRVRAVYLPWNGRYEKLPYMSRARAAAEKVLNERNIEIYDLENEVEENYFYDMTRMNYDIGSPWFTELMDRWL